MQKAGQSKRQLKKEMEEDKEKIFKVVEEILRRIVDLKIDKNSLPFDGPNSKLGHI